MPLDHSGQQIVSRRSVLKNSFKGSLAAVTAALLGKGSASADTCGCTSEFYPSPCQVRRCPDGTYQRTGYVEVWEQRYWISSGCTDSCYSGTIGVQYRPGVCPPTNCFTPYAVDK